MNKLNLILSRMTEPSTWAGLAGLAALFGAPPGTIETVHAGVAGVACLAAVLLPESSKVVPNA